MHRRRQAKKAKVGKQRQGESTRAGAEVESGRDAEPAAELVIAARLSKRLGISTVTLWRWRHDPQLGFPKGRRINDRVYFPWHEVTAWLERQQQTA
jgi:predicted DNA-binding transcriptional regulator AlpA